MPFDTFPLKAQVGCPCCRLRSLKRIVLGWRQVRELIAGYLLGLRAPERAIFQKGRFVRHEPFRVREMCAGAAEDREAVCDSGMSSNARTV